MITKKDMNDIPEDGNGSGKGTAGSGQETMYDHIKKDVFNPSGDIYPNGTGPPDPVYVPDNGHRKSHSRMSGLDAAMEEFRREQSERTDYSKRDAYDYLEGLDDDGIRGDVKEADADHGDNRFQHLKELSKKEAVYAEKDTYTQPGGIHFNDTGPPDLPSVQAGTDRTVPEEAEDIHRRSHSRMSGLDTAMEEFRREQSKRVDYDKRGMEDDVPDTGISSDVFFKPPDKGAFIVPEMGVSAGAPANISQDDINRQMASLLEKRKRLSTNASARVAAAENRMGSAGIRMCAEQTLAGDGNEVAVGINIFRENAMPFLKVIDSSMRGAMAQSMASTLANDVRLQQAFARIAGLRDAKGNLIFKGVNPNRLSLKDMQKIAAGSRRILYGAGITNLNGSPAFMRLQIHKAWATGRLSNGFTGSQIAALAYVANQANKVSSVGNPSKVTIFRIGKLRLQAGAGKVALFRFSKRKVFKTMKQDETFNAMYMTGRFLKQARSILSKLIKLFGFPMRLAKIAAKKALAAARKGTNAAKRVFLNTRTGHRTAKSAVGQALSGTVSTTRQAAGNVRNTARGARKGIRRVKDGFGRFVRTPVRIVTAPFRTVRTIMRLPFRGRYNPLRMLLSFLGNVFATLSIIKTVVIFLIAFLFLFIIIIAILSTFLMSAAGAYDFESKNEEVRKMCFETINQCYSEQIQELSNISATYQNVTINQVDRKSNKAYENKLNYTETTNVTELISMAIVYFDADIDKYAPEPWESLFSGITSIVKPDNPLETYLKEMYYGSHEIDVNPDEEGESAEVTVTTYYFDDLFNCSRSTSFLGNYGGTYDGTGEMIKVKIRAKSAPRAKCSAYSNVSGGDSSGGSYEANAREYYTFALLYSGDWYKNQVHPPSGWHGNTSEHGTYVVINIPERNKGEKGIYGNVIYRKGSEGGGAGDRVFDLFWDNASNYEKAGFGDPVCKTYIPDPSGEMEIEALIRDVDVGEPVENIPGFISKESTTILDVDALPHAKEFLEILQKYSSIIEANHTYVRQYWNSKYKNPRKFFEAIENKKQASLVCCVPWNWACMEMGLKNVNSGVGNWNQHTFTCVTSEMKKHMKKMKSGPAIGLTIKEAVDKKLLQPGDIIGFKGKTHSFVYSGNGYICYDGANEINSYKNGIEMDYSKHYKGYHIGGILRWTD